METEISISIDARNIAADFNTLIKLSGTYKKVNGTKIWTFPLSSINSLDKLVKGGVEFGEEQVRLALGRCKAMEMVMQKPEPKPEPKPEMKPEPEPEKPQVESGVTQPKEGELGWIMPKPETIILPKWKGKSGWTITELTNTTGKAYEILEFRKDAAHNIHQKRTVVTEIAVNLLADVLGEIDHTRFTKGLIDNKPIFEKLIHRYGLTKYLSGSGDAETGKFYGLRTDYFRCFYYPVKVLVDKNEAVHHKHGGVTKLPLLQARLDEINARRGMITPKPQKDISSFA